VPVSYLTLEKGTPVVTADGARVGVVDHVLADPNVDVFDGLIVDTRDGPGGWRFVDAEHVASMDEDEVRLTLDAAAAERLPEPSESPATMSVDPSDTAPDDLSDKLRRAWHWLSGNY
jgi:hypothetical protein